MLPALSDFERHLERMLAGEHPWPRDEDALADVLTTGYAHVASLEADCVRAQASPVAGRLSATRRRADALRRGLADLAAGARAAAEQRGRAAQPG